MPSFCFRKFNRRYFWIYPKQRIYEWSSRKSSREFAHNQSFLFQSVFRFACTNQLRNKLLMSDMNDAEAMLIRNAVHPPELGYVVRYPVKTRTHVMDMGVFGDKYFTIYNSRYMDFWGPKLHLTFFSNAPEETFPVTDIGECRQFVGAEVQSTESIIFIGQYCYGDPETFFAIKIFQVETDFTCVHVNTVLIDGMRVPSNNLSGRFHCADIECKEFCVFWGDMTNNEYFTVSESKQSLSAHTRSYVTTSAELDRNQIPVDFRDLGDVHFTSQHNAYWAEIGPVDVVQNPTLLFVRVVWYDRNGLRQLCAFIMVVNVEIPVGRSEDGTIAYIKDIKHTSFEETLFLVYGTFYKQLDPLNQKLCSAHFLLLVTTTTGKEEILDSIIDEGGAHVQCSMDVKNKRIVRYVE